MKTLNKIKEEMYNNVFLMGRCPNNFDYGMAFCAAHFVFFMLVITSPIWGIFWLLGKITKPKRF